MRSFLVALQFLTRFSLVRMMDWREDDFGRSVKWFPLVGGVLGTAYSATVWLFFFAGAELSLPADVGVVLVMLMTLILTGGLFCDGFMDTMDGIFSGRDRERMLIIMKDSRVGANGVEAFVMLMLMNFVLLRSLEPGNLLTALFVMPVISRFAVVMLIVCFPYARPEGIGKLFAAYVDKSSLWVAFILTMLLVIPFGMVAIIAFAVAIIVALCFGRYVTGLLGGVTGDVYGATALVCELTVLMVFVIQGI